MNDSSPLTSSGSLREDGNTELKTASLLCHCWPGWIDNGKSQTIFTLQQMPGGSLQRNWLAAGTSCVSLELPLRSLSPLAASPSTAGLSGSGAGHGATQPQETAWGSSTRALHPTGQQYCLRAPSHTHSAWDTQIPITGQTFYRKLGAKCSWCWLLNTMRHTEKSGALKALFRVFRVTFSS